MFFNLEDFPRPGKLEAFARPVCRFKSGHADWKLSVALWTGDFSLLAVC